MFKHSGRILAVLMAALTVCLWWASVGAAGKPAPPSPLPAPGLGTIFFFNSPDISQNTDFWQMAPDGSAKSYLFTRTGEYYEPSAMDYGGRRWWLTLRDDGQGYEVYAVRRQGTDAPVWVKLTDVARMGVNGPTGISFWGWNYANVARWGSSNDHADSFVTAVGQDLNSGTWHIWRIDISGYQIDADPGTPVVPVTVDDPRFETIVSENRPINGAYAVSPDGTKVVYHTPKVSTSPDPSAVWVLSSGGKTLLCSDGDRFDWSPDGSKITFTVDPSVWIINSDGSGAKTVAVGQPMPLLSDYSPRYLQSFWSPDGQWLAFRRQLIVHPKGAAYQKQSDIVVIPAAGGQIVNLTGDLDPYIWKLPLAWHPNVSAY
jgi:hypothetical protein